MRRFRLRLPIRVLGETLLRELGLPRRLAGLLSRYLPTDTRPQARAKLGKCRNNIFRLSVKHYRVAAQKTSDITASLTSRARAEWRKSNASAKHDVRVARRRRALASATASIDAHGVGVREAKATSRTRRSSRMSGAVTPIAAGRWSVTRRQSLAERLDLLREAHELEHDHAPPARKMASRMRAIVVPRPNRLAIAQEPAKAAPNTSAPIRIAALTTVSDVEPDDAAAGLRCGGGIHGLV